MAVELRARSSSGKFILSGIVSLATLVTVLFGIAGRVDWPGAWVITAVFAGHLLCSGWWLLRRDPDLLEERLTTAANVPRWDRLIKTGNRILLLIFVATAAFDAGRFRWSLMPRAAQVIGTAVVVAAVGVIWWCGAANHFLAASSRIQSDRGQRVVKDGPYGFVRHPLYASRIVLIAGAALTFGSWIALIPAAVNAVLLILRTALEDRLLMAGLPGYREYAAHVPARLVPGVW